MMFAKFAGALGAIAMVFAAGSASAQQYPNKPIRVIIPFAPGGSTDVIMRQLNDRLREKLGQQLVIEYKPGAGGTTGAQFVSRTPPDGYTILIGLAATAISPSVYPSLEFDPVKSLTPIASIARGPFVLAIGSQFEPRSIKDLVEAARKKPGEINYGSAGIGGSTHLGMEMFNKLAGVNLKHVPYKGSGPAVIDVLAGNIQVVYSDMAALRAQIGAGGLRALGVTSAKRTPLFPDIPTIAEQGVPGYEAYSWYGVFGPPAMPVSIVQTLAAAFTDALNGPGVKERFADIGMEPFVSSPASFGDFMKGEVTKWSGVVRDANIKAE